MAVEVILPLFGAWHKQNFSRTILKNIAKNDPPVVEFTHGPFKDWFKEQNINPYLQSRWTNTGTEFYIEFDDPKMATLFKLTWL